MCNQLEDFKNIEFVYNYLRMISKTKSQAIFDNYARDLGKFCKYFSIDNSQQIEKITKEEFSNFIFELQNTLSTASINGVIRNISPFIQYLLDNEVITTEKISTTKFGNSRYLKGAKKVPFSMTTEEIEKILDKMGSSQIRIMFEFMLNTGVRASEVCNLKMSDIKPDGKIIIKGKGDKERTLGMSKKLEQVLAVWFAMRDTSKEYVFYPTRGRGAKNEKLSPKTVNGRIKDSMLLTDISDERKKRITAHKTRSTLLTYIIENYGIEAARQVAGHSSLQTTQLYNASDIASKTLESIEFRK